MKTYDDLAFSPLSDFILFEPIPVDETEGGIALPAGVNVSDAHRGRVIKVGPGRETEDGKVIPPSVQVGDVIYLYFAYSQPLKITLQGKEFAIGRSRDVIAFAK